MRLLCLLFAVVMLAPAQIDSPPTRTSSDPPARVILPNGKAQKDEIIRMEHQKDQEDAAQLARLSQEVKDELDRTDKYVVSVKTLRKLDEIEKLTKNIRSRLKRY